MSHLGRANHRPQFEPLTPPVHVAAEEAAAVVAAIERFMRETAPAPAEAMPAGDPWSRAALLEGVDREPSGQSPWGAAHPWS